MSLAPPVIVWCEASGCELTAEIGSEYCAFHELLPSGGLSTDAERLARAGLLHDDGTLDCQMLSLAALGMVPPREQPYDHRLGCRVCGKKVKGHGLCANHLSQSYRRQVGKVTGKHVRNRVPTCGHPDRKHKARGLCSPCHQRERAALRSARRSATGASL